MRGQWRRGRELLQEGFGLGFKALKREQSTREISAEMAGDLVVLSLKMMMSAMTSSIFLFLFSVFNLSLSK